MLNLWVAVLFLTSDVGRGGTAQAICNKPLGQLHTMLRHLPWRGSATAHHTPRALPNQSVCRILRLRHVRPSTPSPPRSTLTQSILDPPWPCKCELLHEHIKITTVSERATGDPTAPHRSAPP